MIALGMFPTTTFAAISSHTVVGAVQYPGYPVQVGDRGSYVTALQERLNHIGYSCGTVDGVFGTKTLKAVKAFQRDHKLTADGQVGPQTWGTLFGPSTVPKTPVPTGKYVDWTKPTGGKYPDLHKYKNIWVDVSISQQRTYIKSGSKTIYTMIVSTGIDGSRSTYTPRGTFHIQPERGTWFYAPRFQEGAEYWVSFLGHGQYLFHSVPMDKNRHVIVSIAKDLGHEDSHGCIHLSIPDAKWFYQHIPTGTKVVIHN
jgi:peptidoglycan hydrolase-like protein with peptidoglycan-binding domain